MASAESTQREPSHSIETDANSPLSDPLVYGEPAHLAAASDEPTGSSALALTEEDCNREHIECFRRCWKTAPPWPIERGRAGHYKYCQSKCLAEYMACLSAAGVLRAFSTMVQAMEWLRRNPAVAVGTVVLVAGVAYIVSTGGAGALILLPLGA